MLSIITMLLLISLLVIVHELGHFSVAKYFGVRIDRFGIGLPFGPILYQRLIGKTKFVVHAMLLGGYVAFPEDDPENNIDKNDPDLLSNRPIWQRTAVVCAGVVANVMIAYILVLIAFSLTGGLPTDRGKVFLHSFSFNKAPAKISGLHINDQFYAVNGLEIKNAEHFKELVTINKANDGKLNTLFYQNGLKQVQALNPHIKDPYQKIRKGTELRLPENTLSEPTILPQESSQETISLSPLELTLSKSFDKQIVPSQRQKVYRTDGLTTLDNIVKAFIDGQHKVHIQVIRNNQIKTLHLFPNEQGYIGVQLRMVPIYKSDASPLEFIGGCMNYLHEQALLMLKGLYKLISGQVPLQDLHGIVAITKIGGDIIEQSGIIQGLLLTALISIDLAIVNILPIPALDGGHLVFLIIEKLRGRPVDDKLRESISHYGFMFLIGLMLLIVANDIFALITGKF